jgi:hypothetical protein
MKLFSFFRQQQKPAWTYTAGGAIWRILFSSSGHIVGESREHEQRRASFFCLQEATGEPLWTELTLEEPWWVGIEAVQKDTVLFHGFAKPDMPEHLGIIAFDVERGTAQWRNDELTFWFCYRDHVYAHRQQFEKRLGYKLVLSTGAIEEEFGDAFDELHALRQLAIQEEQHPEFQFPEVIDREADSRLADVVREVTKGVGVQGNIEALRHDPYVLLNYFTPAKQTRAGEPARFQNRLHVVDLERGSEVFSDVITSSAQAPSPDSFFVKEDVVFFVKDDTTLTALKLPKR